jgi:hypothetical protein
MGDYIYDQMLCLQPSQMLLRAREAWGALHSRGWAYFRIIVAPAAGPRNLLTMGWDAQMMLASSAAPMGEQWLCGGSMAALRFCALVSDLTAQPGSENSCSRQLVEAFASMVYRQGDSSAMLGTMMKRLFHIVAPRPSDILLAHSRHRLAITVAALQPWACGLPPAALRAAFYFFLVRNLNREV